MVIVSLGLIFVTREPEAASIDGDNMISGIKMRGKDRLVFAAKNISNSYGHSSQSSPFQIDNKPVAIIRIDFWYICFHLLVFLPRTCGCPKFKSYEI